MKIPEGWRLAKIADIAKIDVGRDVAEESFSQVQTETHSYPVYSNSVENKGFYGFYDYEEFPGGSLTIVARGIGLGKAFSRTNSFGAIGRLIVLTPRDDAFDVNFFADYINHRLRIYYESGGIPQLPGNRLAQYQVILPPLPEQRRIAEILSTWDKAIETVENLIANARTQKKALMQQLLTGKKRLPGFEGEWRHSALKTVAHIIVSNVDKKSSEEEHPVRLCNYMDVYCSDRIEADEVFMHATASLDQIKKFSLRVNDVIITKDSETPDDIAVSAYVASSAPDLVCGYHLAIIRPKKKIDGQFLKYYFEHPHVQHYFASRANGATRFGLTIDAIENAPIMLPLYEEQKRISQVINGVEQSIHSLEPLANALRQEKSALMQQLLTGKRRVKVDN